MTPNIIQETSQGLSHIPLQDALFREREIYCIGEITREYVHALVMQLRWLQHDSPSAEITLYIDSPGGEVGSGDGLLRAIGHVLDGDGAVGQLALADDGEEGHAHGVGISDLFLHLGGIGVYLG